MKRRDFLKTTAIAAAATFSPRLVWAEGKEKRILYFDRSNSYVHPPTIEREDGTTVCGEALKALGEKEGFAVDCSKSASIFDTDLSKYTAMVFYTCGYPDQPAGDDPGMTEQGIINFYNAIRSGQTGLVGIHSATDTWNTPGPSWENQPFEERNGYTNLIGAQFLIHGFQQLGTLNVVEKGFPYIGSLGDSFTYFDEWYTIKNINPDLHVVLVQDTTKMNTDDANQCYNRPPYPSTWIRKEGAGRVAYTSLGHNDSSFWTPTMEGVMTDLLKYTMKDIDIDETPNIKEVCPNCDILKNA